MFLFEKSLAQRRGDAKTAKYVRYLCVLVLFASFLVLGCKQLTGVVHDEDGDATLRSLNVDKGTLSPAFSASHFEYRVTVRNTVDSITVTAAASSSKASVSGDGTKALDIGGGNIITVDVRAENGDSKTYTITAARLDGSVHGIETAQEIAKIGVDDDWPLAGSYALMNDITLENWMPIGTETAPFNGTFNGNRNKITLKSFDNTALSETYIGIFAYVKGASASAKAEIKNLTIDSSVNATGTASSSQTVALVTGYAELAIIENITLSGTFAYTSTNMNFFGGIAGRSEAGTLVKNISSSLNINIVPGGGSYIYVGGIVGRFINGVEIEDCHVIGNITADNVASTASGQVFVGGIAGGSNYAMSTNYHGYIKDSSFNGTVIGRAKGFWTFAGGIAGTIVGGNINDLSATTRIERCFARGTVSVEGTSSGNPYVGGIVGYNYYGALTSQSYFDGRVIADKTGDYTGGIAGYNSQTSALNNSRIEDCWSSGTVTGYANAGGIVGQNQVNTYVRRSYSRAAISANGGIVGGIAGLNASAQTDAITACVALNPSIIRTTGTNNNVHRIVGNNTGNLYNNHAWSDMTVTKEGTYTPAIGATAADGADCAAKPNQAFYQGIGWDFTNVWKMGADGYPQLKWQ